MLRAGKIRERLAGKLLLSTALLAISLAYGWWQRRDAAGANVPPVAGRLSPARSRAVTMPHAAAAAAGDISAKAGQRVNSPVSPKAARLSALAELEMYQPAPVQPPLPLVTGTPPPGVTPAVPPGSHLQDGDYLSDTEQYEWGDLTVKISVHGGLITGVQMVHYPDHRSESLDISQMASPILDSEVIKTQQSKVDVVSSATDTSYVFRDAVASAITKATRW